MTMPVALHLVPLAGFAGLMATAAFEDLRRLVIPNGLIFGLCLLWPIYVATAPMPSPAAAGGAALCASAVLATGALLFARGLLGGGDVKLLAAATLWAGPGATPALLVLTGLLGGVLCLVLLTPLGALVAAAWPRLRDPDGAALSGTGPAVVPYGVAIAAAALIVTLPQHLTW
jgi:prepilin peptidase CpaA